MSKEEVEPNVNEQIEQFIKSENSSQLVIKDSILNGAIYNDSSKPKTKWDDLIEFQFEWKMKLKSNIVVYFNELPPRTPLGIKKNFNKNKMIFKKKFQAYGSAISPFFKKQVNLVVVDTFQNVPPTILAQQGKIKIWDFTKTTQFFQRMSVNVPQLIDIEQDQIETKHEDIIYFENSPHVYLYDILQSYQPIILKHWKDSNAGNLIYPQLNMEITEKSPFTVRGIDNKSYCITNTNTNTNKVKKRYFRDESNKKYALKLKRLYRFNAHFKKLITPELDDYALMESYHDDCLDSRKVFDEMEKIKLKRTNTNFKFMSFNEYDKKESIYNGLSRTPDFDLVELDEESDNNDDGDNDNKNSNLSSQDTLDTELGSDAKLSSLGNFEARTDLQDDINASGFNDICRSSKRYYCENCHIQFTSLQEHANSNDHMTFAHDNTRFIQIDKLLQMIHQ